MSLELFRYAIGYSFYGVVVVMIDGAAKTRGKFHAGGGDEWRSANQHAPATDVLSAWWHRSEVHTSQAQFNARRIDPMPSSSRFQTGYSLSPFRNGAQAKGLIRTACQQGLNPDSTDLFSKCCESPRGLQRN